jgi:hypothetical protein
MGPVIESLDAWRGILDQLQAVTSGICDELRREGSTDSRARASGNLTRPPGSPANAKMDYAGKTAVVRIVELSERSLTIVWHDPTACSYDDQRWRRSRSRRAGVCALTGAAIRRGQDIFKPSSGKPPPANAEAMILASALPVALKVP